MKKRGITAAELMAKLEADPSFQRHSAERDKRFRMRESEHKKILAPVIASLNAIGLQGETIEAIAEKNAPFSSSAVAILISYIQSINEERVLESLVRALCVAEMRFDGRTLADRFDQTSDESLKWAIANTIALTRPHSIEEWLAQKLRHRYWGKTLRELGLDA